jgi:hypothetical protein
MNYNFLRISISICILFVGILITGQSQSIRSDVFYKLKAKHSGLYLDVLGQGIYNKNNVAQWQNTGLANQEWLLAPVNGDGASNGYWIINRHSGLCLDVLGQGIHNEDNVAQWQYTGLNNQIWMLEPAGGYHQYRIKAKHSNLYLDVLGQGIHNEDNVAQWQHTGLDNQVWQLEQAGSFRTPPAPRNNKPVQPGIVMTSHGEPDDYIGELTGVEWIPAHKVQDPGMSFIRRMAESPWYYLERHRSYVVEGDNYWPLGSFKGKVKKTAMVTKSWTEATQRSFSVTTGIEVEAGGEAFGGSVKSSLSMTATMSSSFSQTEEKKEGITYEVEENTSFCVFTIFDTFILRRLNGTKVKSWTLARGNGAASFPPR